MITTQATMQLSAADQAALAGILGCGEAEIEATLSRFASAALREYVEMFLGKGVFTRGSDLLEFRLRLLTEHAFANTIPDEARVSQLFQTSPQASRTMIRSLVSKYQYQLQDAVFASLRAILQSAKQEEQGADWTFTTNSLNLVELLNQRLAAKDGSQRRVRKQKDSVSTFEIAPASYDILRTEFKLDEQ
ncbi:MAG: hypothetical protein ACREEB_01410 [Caulobacteraceae bacterium]